MPDAEYAEIQRALGRLEGKQDAILSRLMAVDTHIIDHDKRLTHLEKKMASRAGIVGFLTGLVASVAAIFGQNWLGK